jgi:hypothetical protein
LPRVQELQAKYGKDGLVVVGIHDPLGSRNLKPVLDRSKITHSVGIDGSAKLNIQRYKVKGYPTFTFIGRDGKIRYADVLFDSLETATTTLLKEPAAPAAPAAPATPPPPAKPPK